MNLLGHIWIFISRICLLLTGLLVLVCVLPHKGVWDMEYVAVHGKKGEHVTITVPKPAAPTARKIAALLKQDYPVRTSMASIFKWTGILLLALVALTRAGRRAAFRCVYKVSPALVILLATGLFLFTMTPTHKGNPIVLQLVMGSLGLVFCLVGIHPLALWLGKRPLGRRIRGAGSRASAWFYTVDIKFFLGAIFLAGFFLAILGSHYLFEQIPHIMDSADQVFHAKIFALGKLFVPSHQYREFFDFTHMINNGKWFSQYPPAHTFMLMLGVMAGAPWIVNPILGALSMVTVYFMGKEAYDAPTGRLAALLCLFSTSIVFMSTEFMGHATTLLFTSLFVLFFLRTIKQGGWRNALLCGASMGVALCGRPMSTFGVCLPFIILAAVLLLVRARKYILSFAVISLTVAAFIGLLLMFNKHTTGDPLLFGVQALHGEGVAPGFGHSGWGEPHTPEKGLIQNLNNLNAFNKYFFEWPIPSLLFVLLLFASMTRNRWDYVFMGSFCTLSLVYFFYWYQDWCFGPRFLYESSTMIILLTARGLRRLPKLLNHTLGLNSPPGRINAFSAATVALCVLLGVTFLATPWIKHYKNGYYWVRGDVLRAVKEYKVDNAVVFVCSEFGEVFAHNSPLLDNEIIYARDLGQKNALLMRHYPGRKYFRAHGPELRQIHPPRPGDQLIEAESLKVVASSGEQHSVQRMKDFGSCWSGGAQNHTLANGPGDYFVLEVPVPEEGVYEVSAHLTNAPNYGRVRLLINGEAAEGIFDGYNTRVGRSPRLFMGEVYLGKGKNRFKLLVTGKNPAATSYWLGVDDFILRRVGSSLDYQKASLGLPSTMIP